MSKKRIAVMVAGVAMFATLAVGSTMAWFTDTENATNKFTMGFVDVVLNDNSEDDKIISDDTVALHFDKVMPGDELEKEVSFNLASGSAASYIRAKVEFAGITQDYATPSLTLEDVAAPGAGWTYDSSDEYYYYDADTTTTEIDPISDADTVNFFDEVNIPTSWGNDMTNQDFTLTITVDAIQAENFTPGTDSWGTIAEYTAPAID